MPEDDIIKRFTCFVEMQDLMHYDAILMRSEMDDRGTDGAAYWEKWSEKHKKDMKISHLIQAVDFVLVMGDLSEDILNIWQQAKKDVIAGKITTLKQLKEIEKQCILDQP